MAISLHKSKSSGSGAQIRVPFGEPNPTINAPARRVPSSVSRANGAITSIPKATAAPSQALTTAGSATTNADYRAMGVSLPAYWAIREYCRDRAAKEMIRREFGPSPADLEGPSVANTLHRVRGTAGSFAPVGLGIRRASGRRCRRRGGGWRGCFSTYDIGTYAH